MSKKPSSKLKSQAAASYCFDRLSRLTLETQLHFAAFLYLWDGDQTAARHLHRIKPAFTMHGDLDKLFRHIKVVKARTHYTTAVGPVVAKYFKRHPELYTHTWLLFYVMYLETVYGINSRDQLLKFVPLDEFTRTRQAILADNEALAILSVVGINNLYGYDYLLERTECTIDLHDILARVKPYYDLDNRMHLRFLAYLYTHFVIDETAFFSRQPTIDRRMLLISTMTELEELIATRYTEISLDIKCEFVACCRYLRYSSVYESVINNEVANSKSPRGDFAYDRFNLNPAPKPRTLEGMAHTMAFYVISNRPNGH